MNFQSLYIASVVTLLVSSSLRADLVTNVLDTNINTAAGWSSGPAFPTSADTVTFNKDGTWSSDFNTAMTWGGDVIVNHTAGNLVSTNNTNVFNSQVPSGFTWNVSASGAIVAGDDIYFRGPGSWNFGFGSNLKSKGLQLVVNDGAVVTFETGSTTTLDGRPDYAVRFNNAASTLNWHGGNTNFSGDNIFYFQTNTGTVDIAGNFTLIAESATRLVSESSAGTTGYDINFSNGWSGSFTLSSSFTASEIQTELIESGATLNGADIDSGNISAFSISDGYLSLASAPSPATSITDVDVVTSAGTASGTKATITFTADGTVDVYASDDLVNWGTPIATNVFVSPIVMDNLSAPRKFYVLVSAGGNYPNP